MKSKNQVNLGDQKTIQKRFLNLQDMWTFSSRQIHVCDNSYESWPEGVLVSFVHWSYDSP